MVAILNFGTVRQHAVTLKSSMVENVTIAAQYHLPFKSYFHFRFCWPIVNSGRPSWPTGIQDRPAKRPTSDHVLNVKSNFTENMGIAVAIASLADPDSVHKLFSLPVWWPLS